MIYDSNEFYSLRDHRTTEYLGGKSLQDKPVHVKIDHVSAENSAGQLLFLSLINQLARVHRNISIEIPKTVVKNMISTPFPGTTLSDVAIQTMKQIDPYGSFVLGERPSVNHISIGIGFEVGDGFDWYLGADRAVAYLQQCPAAVTPLRGSLIGAALAACLGAGAAFRAQIDKVTSPRVLSAWNYKENAEADFGPEEFGYCDIGKVLMVGTGAVGASLAYWLYSFGVSGYDWSIVDGDDVELHNTNRGLIFTADHAGWLGSKIMKKVDVVAPLLPGSTSYPEWYDQCEGIKNIKFDVILALANDRSVRQLLAHRNAVVLLQATTGENWLSQLHRHILGKDDCIMCRTGEMKEASFGCSTVQVEQQNGISSDAALPFLSAASGLMLATALMRLEQKTISDGPHNCWSWDFGSDYKMATRPNVRICRNNCTNLLPLEIRNKINTNTKWATLLSKENFGSFAV